MTTAILDFRPAAPGLAASERSGIDLVRLLALDRLPAKRPLLCHWHRDGDGRLSCAWEPDLAPVAALSR
jgi:hypothetical protein